MEFCHKSVLLDECIEALRIRPDGIYLDGTLGGAGHSFEIARRLTTGRLIGVDRDAVALGAAQKRLAPFADRVTTVHSNFSELDSILDKVEAAQASLSKTRCSGVFGKFSSDVFTELAGLKYSIIEFKNSLGK